MLVPAKGTGLQEMELLSLSKGPKCWGSPCLWDVCEEGDEPLHSPHSTVSCASRTSPRRR